MTYSMPLSGDSRPNVRITVLPSTPSRVLAARVDRHVRNPVRNQVDLVSRDMPWTR